MRVIKRYPNRKLYDTERKRYVTLEQVEEFVRGGEEVRVVDHQTGEDLTHATLSQILLDRQRRKPNLPKSILEGIIQGGGRLKELVADRFDTAVTARLEAAVRRLGLPTRREVEALTRKVEALERRLAASEKKKRRASAS